MQLTPREVEKLMVYTLADVAQRRRDRGVMLSLSLEQINNSYPRVPVQATKAFYQFPRHTVVIDYRS